MTNEELAVKAKAGDKGALLELWEQNRGLAYVFARRRYDQLEAQGNMRGADIDDLKQAAFLALVRAVDYYDPEKGSFNTAWDFYVRHEYNLLLGLVKNRREDLLNHCISLDTPLKDEADPDLLISVIPDPSDDYEKKDHELWCAQLHEVTEKMLAQLPPDQQQALRLRYYDEFTYTQAAGIMGLTRDEYRAVKGKALHELRKPIRRRELEAFIDLNTNFYRTGSAERQSRPVESSVIRREWQREKYAIHFAD